MVPLVTCDGKLACKGGLIDGGKTMLFLGLITSGNTMLLLPVAGGMIDGRDRHFFSRLVNGLGAYVRWQISLHRRTDQWRQHNVYSWYDQRRQHNATSSRRGWTDQRRRHGASSLGWSTVWLVTCDGKSACMGRLIDGGDTMLFLGKINGNDMTLLHSAG
jgi:hypothetical protein